jgi:hypothetical protein
VEISKWNPNETRGRRKGQPLKVEIRNGIPTRPVDPIAIKLRRVTGIPTAEARRFKLHKGSEGL